MADMTPRQKLENEKKNLGLALTKLGEVIEKLKTGQEKWVYINSSVQTRLKESVKRLGGEITQIGDCGVLTKEINFAGRLIYDSIAKRSYGPVWDSLEFLPEEEIELLKSCILSLESKCKKRLDELALALTKDSDEPCAMDILELLFPKYYAQLSLNLSDTEISISKNYNDGVLRAKLARILKQSDIVPAAEKAKLDQYASEPHTGYEMSDFCFNVEYNDNILSVHIVIKSSKETKGKANEEKVWYQITKPIEEGFDFSIFMATDGMTSPLTNRFKKYNRNQCDDCLEYIIDAEVARLLKSYGELE